jgi:adenosine/AMP kinase
MVPEVVMKIETVKLKWSEGCNVIIGQAHFIKTVEDLAEILVSAVPNIKYGLAFNEASGPCLVRTEGTDTALIADAAACANAVGAGHTFYVVLRDCYPINVLNQIKNCQEVCRVFCATANPVEVVVAVAEGGNAILGVADGERPKGVESERDKAERKGWLRKFGYKFC